jgi:hypothetical protein
MTSPDERPEEPFAWLPGSEVDAELFSALAADDRRRFFQIVRDAPWYLPALPADGDGQRFLTRELLGGTYLLVFTSVRSLVSVVGPAVDGYTITGYAELSERWPVPSWRLAVNAGTPVDAWVTLPALVEAAEGTRVVPTLESLSTRDDAAVDAFLRRMFEVTLFVPASGHPPAYQVVRRDGQLMVEVYTSPRLLPPGVRYLPASLTDLVLRWPGPEYALAIDPGSDTPLVLSGDRVPGLLLWSEHSDSLPREQSRSDTSAGYIVPGDYADGSGASTERG